MADHAAESKTPLLNAKTRTYLYNIALAAQPIAVGYGLVAQDMSALWINAVAAVLGLVVARTNITPDAKP